MTASTFRIVTRSGYTEPWRLDTGNVSHLRVSSARAVLFRVARSYIAASIITVNKAMSQMFSRDHTPEYLCDA